MTVRCELGVLGEATIRTHRIMDAAPGACPFCASAGGAS
jgi:hypothetical protein